MSPVLDMECSAVGPPLGVMRCDALFSAWKKWSVLLLASFNSEKLSCAGFGATSSRYRSSEKTSESRLSIWQPRQALLFHGPGQPRRQPVTRHPTPCASLLHRAGELQRRIQNAWMSTPRIVSEPWMSLMPPLTWYWHPDGGRFAGGCTWQFAVVQVTLVKEQQAKARGLAIHEVAEGDPCTCWILLSAFRCLLFLGPFGLSGRMDRPSLQGLAQPKRKCL